MMIEETHIEKEQSPITDVAMNWNATRLAVVNSEVKLLRLYRKSERDASQWTFVQRLVLEVVPRKIKWGHPDFGTSFIVKTSDNNVLVYKEMKGVAAPTDAQGQKISKWELLLDKNSKFPDSTEARMVDVKFSPSHLGTPRSPGYSLSVIYDSGEIEMFNLTEFYDPSSPRPARSRFRATISHKPLRCFSWKKDEEQIDALAIAYQDQNQTPMESKKDRISLWVFKEDFKKVDSLSQINELLSNEIEDANWAITNGKSFHTLCCCGRDGIIVCRLQLALKASVYETTVLDVFQDGKSPFSYPIRCKFNHVASFITTSTNDSKLKIWRKIENNKWEEEKLALK